MEAAADGGERTRLVVRRIAARGEVGDDGVDDLGRLLEEDVEQLLVDLGAGRVHELHDLLGRASRAPSPSARSSMRAGRRRSAAEDSPRPSAPASASALLLARAETGDDGGIALPGNRPRPSRGLSRLPSCRGAPQSSPRRAPAPSASAPRYRAARPVPRAAHRHLHAHGGGLDQAEALQRGHAARRAAHGRCRCCNAVMKRPSAGQAVGDHPCRLPRRCPPPTARRIAARAPP